MKPTNLLLGLVPWIAFSVIAEALGAQHVGIAAGIACLGSLLLAIRGARADGLKIIDAAGVVTFAALAVIGFMADHSARVDLANYGRGGSTLVLALVMLVSVFTYPFTLQYARAQVDRRYWGSPVFKETNRKISLVWAGLVGAMACSHLISGALRAHHTDRPVLNIILNWGVPLVVVVQGMKITNKLAGQKATVRGVA